MAMHPLGLHHVHAVHAEHVIGNVPAFGGAAGKSRNLPSAVRPRLQLDMHPEAKNDRGITTVDKTAETSPDV